MIQIIKQIIKIIYGYFCYLKFILIESNKIKKANIIFILPFYHTGGAEKVHLDILNAVKHKKCCVIFTHLSATKNYYEAFKSQSQIIELNSIRNKKSAFLNKILKRSILKNINTSQSIHAVFGCNTPFFYEILPGIKTNIKRVDLIHALSKNDEREAVLASSIPFVDHRICINAKAKNDLTAIYKKYHAEMGLVDKLKIIENGVVINEASKLTKQPSQNIKFGFIGRWSEEKRPELFLEVAKKIQANHANVEFVMAGTGMKSNLKQINEAGVHFLGEITSQVELNKLYESLTGVIISSVYEGFPMVIMESMVFNTIPIATNVGGISQHIKHLDNGLLISSNSYSELVNDFVKEITFLIENKAEIQRMSDTAKTYAIANFNIDNFNNSYRNLLELS
ncbi:glycosyltransferase family 4 protein [Tamlana agarivorans]|uniref:Glycosyltransferase family 4 protein n=1 Tax=Pseudotamlana agarivorans TaxID=481183 RepID=A0ACC5UD66_9FLAO|nr:glycosyltransferase family 4 protein [Tamlana agarivorans]MBU2952148.1 glycosyltransferase family 4 protein [Tamlana agarivorans]